MLTIIIGLIVTALLSVLAAEDLGFAILARMVFIFCFVIGAFVPVSGYHESNLEKEIELVSLSNTTAFDDTGVVYVSLSDDNMYTYRYETESEHDTETSKEYVTATVNGSIVKEIEDSECETPVLRVYCEKAKKSIWTLALFCDEIEYVFYVPEGTISK